MDSFLTEVKGFTPVIEVMVQEVGLVQAAVYGVVWRYCQRRDGVCTASHETIAEALGLARGTVQRHLKELCEAGYLNDTTPDRRNRPHVYADTGRAQIIGLVEAKVTVSEKYSAVSEKYSPLYQKDTRREYNSIEESHVTADGDAGFPPADEEQEPAEEMSGGEIALDAIFGPRTEPKAEPITSTGDWTQKVSEPWRTWGAESEELQRQKRRFGANADAVLRLGCDLDKALGLRPIWATPKKVKSWLSGLSACLLSAEEFGHDLVMDTARKMRENKLTIKDPWSIEGMVAAAAAEKRSGGAANGQFGVMSV